MQDLPYMDPSFQSYRAKPLEGNLNNLHRSLVYPDHPSSYKNTQQTAPAPIYYLSRDSHTYSLSTMFINSTASNAAEESAK